MKNLCTKAANKLTVKEVHANYIIRCKARNLSEKTIELYTVHYSVFKRFLNDEEVLITDISLSILDKFTLYLKDRGCNDITILSYMRNMRSFLYYCMDEKIIDYFKIRLPKAEKRIKETYTDEELEVLLKKPDLKKVKFTEYKTWVFSNYLLATGNRISSALGLAIGNIDFENSLIQVDKVKNKKAYIIPLSNTLARILKEYLLYRKGEKDDYLFCDSYGNHANIRVYQDLLHSYNKKRGVAKTSAHLYRHTFAKKWILNGGDIFRLQKLLGHSDLAIVKEYVNMFGRDLSKDFEQFNPLDCMGIGLGKERIKLKKVI